MPFEKEGMKAQRMEINLENILPSLAKNLYGDDWRISIRELLQNCHDALTEAELRGVIKHGVGQISITPDPGAGTLTFVDNGMGMTAEEVQEYMATVGAGRKREQLEQMAKEGKGDRELLDRLIGQYGIGFLSSFIIADRVQVLTRSQDKKAAAGVRALFTGETQWYSAEDNNAPYGTKIILQLKTGAIVDPVTGEETSIRELLNFERLKEEVRRFGDLLPYTIYVHRSPEDPNGEICNAIEAPWEKDVWDEGALLDFLKRRHQQENEPLNPVPFRFDNATHGSNAHGIMYFPCPSQDRRRSNESVAQVELFCRRMFITNDITALLPEWCSFVEVIVECPDLTPTLNRNDVIRHDPPFVALRQALGRRLTEEVKNIAERKPRIFGELRNAHGERLYRALCEDYRVSKHGEESFFRGVIHHLPFIVLGRSHPTGTAMTLPKYREEARKRTKGGEEESAALDRVFYLEHSPSLGQYRAMIIQRDLPVIEAIHPAEPLLLKAYGEAYSNEVSVENVSDILELYVDTVDQKPYEAMTMYMRSLEDGEADEVRATRFDPSYVPAIAIVRSAADEMQAKILEKFLAEAGGVLAGRIRDQLMREVRDARYGKASLSILLNDKNSLVRALRDQCAAGNALAGVTAEVLHEIHHIAKAYTEPRMAESQHFFEHRNAILQRLVDASKNLETVQAAHDRLKLGVDSIRREKSALEAELNAITGGGEEAGAMTKRECVLLLTDLRGSSRLVGFLDKDDSAAILQEYADKVQRTVTGHDGRIDKFTGDGIFAYFDVGEAPAQETAQRAYDSAAEISLLTDAFFGRDAVARVLLKSGGIKIEGCRTVLHYGEVMYGRIGGAVTLVGPQVVALFRACNRDSLFQTCSTILSDPFLCLLRPAQQPKPLVSDVEVDPHLPPMTFYAHPGLVGRR